MSGNEAKSRNKPGWCVIGYRSRGVILTERCIGWNLFHDGSENWVNLGIGDKIWNRKVFKRLADAKTTASVERCRLTGLWEVMVLREDRIDAKLVELVLFSASA